MSSKIEDGRSRVVIENVRPEVDGGRFAIKRTVGEQVQVEADVFADGHDVIRCLLLHRAETGRAWRGVAMQAIGNDRWRGSFTVDKLGRHVYTVMAWIDQFFTWRHDLARRNDAADIALALRIGATLVRDTAGRANGTARARLEEFAAALDTASTPEDGKRVGGDAELGELMARHGERRFPTTYAKVLAVTVEPERARYSTWYELFPRSCSDDGRHGRFKDCERRLPYIAAMGFDVLYMPPIHPIGTMFRKGPNNALVAAAGDPGSPWAIGADDGGHKAVHAELGTLDDFRHLVAAAREHGIDIAMDIAFQCAPDHPYVKEHPDWFRWRPDGTVQYAENPPKKYQDIYPFDFESDDWRGLWAELASVFGFWIDEGVRIFRVDNPHTKAFPFWEWAIAALKRAHPDLIFLAEAFTRPKVMQRLAKLGYTQSYTYFAWRNTRHELTEYFTELAHGPGREYFRPNVWPNTPDILTEYLQFGGRPAFIARLVLAATLAASYGIYGPAFELCEREAREPGSEEYRDSEKYQLRSWDLDRPDSLAALIARVNRARRENPALQRDGSLAFYPVDNESIICYGKTTPDGDNAIVTVVNLDPYHVQSGWVELDTAALGIDAHSPYQMHELLTGARYLWSGPRNFVRLDPQRSPAHVFRLRRRVRSERDFDYFL